MKVIAAGQTISYKPYNGPEGPSNEQAEYNTEALAKALTALKIPFQRDREHAKKLWDGDDLNLMIIHPKDGQVIYVGYDRWGYCADDMANPLFEIDQADLARTIHNLKKWYNS